MMRVFRACPAPDVGSSTACRGSKFHSLLKARIPWSQGKKQGIFSIQPFFAKIRFENICEFSCLRVNSLRRQSREFFCQGREFFAWAGNRREFGARPIRSPRRIRSRQKCFLVVDKRILNAGCGPDEHAWLLPTGRAFDARVPSPGSNPPTLMTKRKRSTYFWASPNCRTPFGGSARPTSVGSTFCRILFLRKRI